VSPSGRLLTAIARAVEHQGGDIEDVEDLIAVWERVARRNQERGAVCQREAGGLAASYREREDAS
jgi:hypothetical protein